MTIGRKRTTRRTPTRKSAPGDHAVDAVIADPLEIDPDSLPIDPDLPPIDSVNDPVIDPDAPEVGLEGEALQNESIRTDTGASQSAERDAVDGAPVPIFGDQPSPDGSRGSSTADTLTADTLTADTLTADTLTVDSGDTAVSGTAVSGTAVSDAAVSDAAVSGSFTEQESSNIAGGSSPAESLLARWKTPSWATDAGEPTPAAKPGGDELEIDSIPALLRLPPRAPSEESPARIETGAPDNTFPSAGTSQSSDNFNPTAGAEDALGANFRQTAEDYDTSGSAAGEDIRSRLSDWRESGARIPSTEDQGARDESAAPALTFRFRAKDATAPTPEEAAEQQDWAAPRTGRIGNRSELSRGPQGRGTNRPGGGPRSAREEESQVETTSAREGVAPGREDFLESELEDAVSGTDAGAIAEEGEGRDDRPGRRRRKDRRGRRPERNGTRDASDDDVVEMDGAVLGRLPADVEPAGALASEPPAAVLLQDEEQVAELETLSRISLDQRLGKELFVNTGSRETRIAYVVAGALTELHLEREERLVGAICKARVDRVLPGMDAAFVDAGLERNAFLQAGDVVPDEDDDDQPGGRRPSRHMSIADLLKPRQEIMVQVTKAPHSTKGARVSTRISLPGRFLVLMPDTETVGVSRKIDDDDERDRLKKIARSIRPSGFGVIVRTEAENKTEEELRSDVAFLVRLWGQIQQKYRSARAGTIVHRDLSLTFKVVRDLFGSDVNRFVIDSRDEYEKVMELVDFITPKMKSRVLLYEDPIPLFERIGIEDEIERLFRNKVWLKSGGTLLLDETEALTTIDVNTGKYVGTTNLSQTIFKINMEAVVEICRQLRLRDIGGMIILDFIDMSNARDRAAVMKALEVNLKKDRSRTKIAHLSPLGLVEMTRKRTGETFRELTTEPCDYCGGRGRTMNPDTVSIRVEREIKKLSQEYDDEAFLVMVHPAVAPFLLGPEGVNTDRLEREIRRGVYVRSTDNLHIEKFEVAPVDMQEVERQLLPHREGQVVDCIVEQSAAFNLPHAVARMDGYLLDLVNGGQYLGRKVRARLTRVGRSMAIGEVVGGGRAVDKLGGI